MSHLYDHDNWVEMNGTITETGQRTEKQWTVSGEQTSESTVAILRLKAAQLQNLVNKIMDKMKL